MREHIQFFSRLKGQYSKLSWQEAEDEVDRAIQDVALSEKRNTLSKHLSGGMKRKLSVAMAFCGGSKVVLLDEPTSGMVGNKLAVFRYFCSNVRALILFFTLSEIILHRTRSRGGLLGMLFANTDKTVALS